MNVGVGGEGYGKRGRTRGGNKRGRWERGGGCVIIYPNT